MLIHSINFVYIFIVFTCPHPTKYENLLIKNKIWGLNLILLIFKDISLIKTIQKYKNYLKISNNCLYM